MPQLIIKHCCIADVMIDDDPKGKQDKIVKLNVDEEDFFDMLDHINPKNIIKYLDMRGIAHRDGLLVSVKPIDATTLPSKEDKEYGKAIGRLRGIESSNARKLERVRQLIDSYGPSNSVIK